jgi:hypothetical protein
VVQQSPEKPLFGKLGEKFNPMELLSIMKGDITKVLNIANRMKEVLTQMIGGQSRS